MTDTDNLHKKTKHIESKRHGKRCLPRKRGDGALRRDLLKEKGSFLGENFVTDFFSEWEKSAAPH